MSSAARFPPLIVCFLVGTVGCFNASCNNGQSPPPAEPASAKGQENAELLWQQRESEACLRRAIGIYEEQLEMQPSVALCNRLCRAYYLLADVFLEGDEDAQSAVHWKAVLCALEGLKLQEEFRTALKGQWPSATAIGLVDREHAEPLFWWAAHLGRWLSLKDLMTQVRHRTRLTAALERVGALDDRILAGSLYRTWGAYYAHGGDMAKARENFERAVEIATFMLLTRVMYAKECAVPAGDKDLFVRQLTLALQEPEPDIPEILPEFRLYRGRARDLLEQTQQFFPY